jgi:hypothetical protein
MTTRVRNRVLFAVALVAALVAGTFGAATPARADVVAAGCSARAVVVVEPGPGPLTICFDGAISGLEALQLAGANPATYGFAGQGAAVCQLFGVGNPSDSSCLIGSGGQYWAYYRAGPGAGGWTYSRAGANQTTVTDGSVEGWRYGTGAAPNFVSFCNVVGCGPPPTEPPPPTYAPPPVPVAPAPGPSTPAPLGDAATPPTSASTVGPAKDAGTGKTDGARSGESATADGKDAKDGRGSKDSAKDSATTTSRRSGTKTSERREQSDTVEVAAGGTGGGSDGGSPVGVLVALAVVAVGVAGGLLLRRRRRGPAPG